MIFAKTHENFLSVYVRDSLKDRYSSFRKPFQQKYALLATAIDLLKTLDFLDDSARQEIMFAGKEPLAPHQAWRRKGLITKEMNQTFLPKAKELMGDEDNQERSHDEICEMLLQSMYVSCLLYQEKVLIKGSNAFGFLSVSNKFIAIS